MENSVIKFKNESFSNIGSALNEHRIDEKFTDLTIKSTDGKYTKAHKTVLSATCPYFHGMFNTDFKETHQNEIELRDDMTMEFLEIILEYLYTGEIKFESSKCKEIYIRAWYMELKELVNFCTGILIDNLNLYDCLEMLRFAEKFKDDKIKTEVVNMIKSNQTDFLRQFCMHLTFDELDIIKDAIDLNTNPEFMFKIFYRWFEVDSELRKKEFLKLIEDLDFTCMSKKFFEKEVLTVEILSENCVFLKQLLKEFALSPQSPQCLQILSEQGIHKFDPNNNFTFDTTFEFNEELSEFTAASFENFIFVSQDQYFSSIDVWTGEINLLPKLTFGRTLGSAIAFKEKIYYCGGGTESVEIFDIKSSLWTVGPNMNEKKTLFGLCATDDCIYAFGGLDGIQLEYLDPREGEWKFLAKDPTKCFKSCLFEHKMLYGVDQANGQFLFDLRLLKNVKALEKPGIRFNTRSFDLVNLNGELYSVCQDTQFCHQCTLFELSYEKMNWKKIARFSSQKKISCLKFFDP